MRKHQNQSMIDKKNDEKEAQELKKIIITILVNEKKLWTRLNSK